MSHFISQSCKGERCRICGAPATHKAGEEILPDDPHQIRHNLTAYICCKHFVLIFGEHAHQPLDASNQEQLLGFSLDAEALKKFGAWLEQHDTSCPYREPANQGASGGRFTYSFTLTKIGVVAKITCACGEATDVSDYENW